MGHAGIADFRSSRIEPFKVDQWLEIRHPRLRDFGAVEVEHSKIG